MKDLFTGQRWIVEIGLYDDRNRFMSPALGRFIQPDPIGFKGDASNLYRYCGNDWANRTDPMGTEDTDSWRITSNFVQRKMNEPFQSERGSLGSQMLNVQRINFRDAQKDMAGFTMGRPQIVDIAGSKVGSTDYMTNKTAGNYPAGANKCNKLPADAIEESGRPRPQVPYTGFRALFKKTRDPSANEWASPNVTISNWSGPKPISEARRNDVIAQAHGQFGHVGIVEGSGSTISVNTKIGGIVQRNDWGFRDPPLNGESIHDPAPVVRHYTGDE